MRGSGDGQRLCSKEKRQRIADLALLLLLCCYCWQKCGTSTNEIKKQVLGRHLYFYDCLLANFYSSFWGADSTKLKEKKQKERSQRNHLLHSGGALDLFRFSFRSTRLAIFFTRTTVLLDSSFITIGLLSEAIHGCSNSNKHVEQNVYQKCRKMSKNIKTGRTKKNAKK